MADLERRVLQAISNIPSALLELLLPHLPVTCLSEPASGSLQTVETTPSQLSTDLSSREVEPLSRTDGAIFDHLFRYVKSPQDLYNAFERGFAGCPSIDVMDASTSKYRRWRAGGDRHKKFYDRKVVISDIRNQTQDKVDQEKSINIITLTQTLRNSSTKLLLSFIRCYVIQRDAIRCDAVQSDAMPCDA